MIVLQLLILDSNWFPDILEKIKPSDEIHGTPLPTIFNEINKSLPEGIYSPPK